MISKYHRKITKKINQSDIQLLEDGTAIVSVELDFYDVAMAWEITNPATQHGMKKLFMPGARGAKGRLQDMEEALFSLQRAIELEKDKPA